MSRRKISLIAFLLMLLSGSTIAQDTSVQAAVSVSVEQNQEIWTGQQVTVNLDLKTTGYSFSNAQFNLPEISGAFLMQTDTTTIKLSEKRDGKDWQILRYPLALYPLKSGQLEVPPIAVRFVTSEGFGSEEKSFEFLTDPVEVSISLPPGVDQGEQIVTTADFTLSHSWQPETEVAKTGDALTLTVKRRARDISAMLLPPLPIYRTEGLAAYPQAPDVEDRTNRGELSGERTDSIIWVVEKAGTYAIPGIRFQWWDPVKHELRQQIVAGINLDVIAAQQGTDAMTTVQTTQPQSRQMLFWLVLLVPVVIALGVWFKRSRSGHDVNSQTEKSVYSTLQKACKENQAKEAHTAIYDWLDHCPPMQNNDSSAMTLNKFANVMNNKQLTAELEKLQIAIISSPENWNGQALSSAIKDARHKINAQKTVQSRVNLSPLNP